MAVLPALVDRLETVTVGIENVRNIITVIVIQARAGLAVVGCSFGRIARAKGDMTPAGEKFCEILRQQTNA